MICRRAKPQAAGDTHKGELNRLICAGMCYGANLGFQDMRPRLIIFTSSYALLKERGHRPPANPTREHLPE
jgi:hypothetical protein